MRTLEAAGLRAAKSSEAAAIIANAAVVVDALVGYGLRGAARGMAAELIGLCNRSSARIISLDVPSGLDATTGDSAGPVVRAQIVLTLALPKTGLERLDARIYLADIGIAPALFGALGLRIGPMFRSGYRLPLHRS